MMGIDWTSIRLKDSTATWYILAMNHMGGLRNRPGSGIWTATFMLTQRPDTYCVKALLNQMQAAEKEQFYRTSRSPAACCGA